MSKIIYDGTEAVFGRLASRVAKDLLKGEEVDIINCEKIIVSGDKRLFVEKILEKKAMGSGSSLKGPKYPRVADKLIKRMIRGMLPSREKARGRDAFRRLRVYIGGENKDAIKLNYRKPMRYASIEEIVRLLK